MIVDHLLTALKRAVFLLAILIRLEKAIDRIVTFDTSSAVAFKIVTHQRTLLSFTLAEHLVIGHSKRIAGLCFAGALTRLLLFYRTSAHRR